MPAAVYRGDSHIALLGLAKEVSAPILVLSLPADKPDVRVVRDELPDRNGVMRIEYVLETTDFKTDAMGVQQWTRITDKSAWSDWNRAARRFLDELLKAQGETRAENK